MLCPEGHESESTDYCDTCGSPMGAAGPGAATAPPHSGEAPTAPQPVAATQTCPHCGALNVEDALFCEACGYDFTTGTPPMGSGPADEHMPATQGQRATADEAETTAGEAELAADKAEPAAEEAEPVAEEAEAVADEGGPRAASAEAAGGRTTTDPEQSGAEASPSGSAAAKPRKARHTPPSRELTDTWVVEVWIDPDWYAVQQTEDACPSAGVPDIVLLTRSTALIGRPSGSLGVRPEVYAGSDSAVSRRHAQLTSDGRRWWIEDLGSSNGTFVGTVGEPLPTEPLGPGQRVEIDRDDRIYVGAWTRLVLRQATEAEKRGEG